jgi:uncharacterized protein
MTPTAQRAAGPMEWFLQGIPPHSDHDISIKEPGIYFGAGEYTPAIAPNDSRELNYASDDAVELTDYRGSAESTSRTYSGGSSLPFTSMR